VLSASVSRDDRGSISGSFESNTVALEDPGGARQRYARGESVPLFRSYADPSVLTDEIIRLYLQPLLSSKQRIEAFERYWLGFDNRQTTAIHSALRALQVPTLIV
jgi:hypothetical protein